MLASDSTPALVNKLTAFGHAVSPGCTPYSMVITGLLLSRVLQKILAAFCCCDFWKCASVRTSGKDELLCVGGKRACIWQIAWRYLQRCFDALWYQYHCGKRCSGRQL